MCTQNGRLGVDFYNCYEQNGKTHSLALLVIVKAKGAGKVKFLSLH